jgi:release factor glutamine methyltransferase
MGELRRELRALLESAGVAAAEVEADWIVEAVTGQRRAERIAGGRVVTPHERDRALEMARRRAAGEPLQYLTGVAGFRRLELRVGPGVFIPRPETEMVVERALDHLPHAGVAVDACTGSGAIALALKDERPDVTVYATETSTEALAWAKRNRAELGLDVTLLLGDLLGPLPDELAGRVDLVVSNPPYVRADSRSRLPRDVIEHEPHVALFAPGRGLGVIARLAQQALGVLRPGGWLVCEISGEQREEASRLFEAAGYADVRTSQDLAGHERIVEGRRP